MFVGLCICQILLRVGSLGPLHLLPFDQYEESSPSDTNEIGPEAERERRTLKAAYWVLAVDVYIQRKQELQESEGLFKIEHTSDFD